MSASKFQPSGLTGALPFLVVKAFECVLHMQGLSAREIRNQYPHEIIKINGIKHIIIRTKHIRNTANIFKNMGVMNVRKSDTHGGLIVPIISGYNINLKKFMSSYYYCLKAILDTRPPVNRQASRLPLTYSEPPEKTIKSKRSKPPIIASKLFPDNKLPSYLQSQVPQSIRSIWKNEIIR